MFDPAIFTRQYDIEQQQRRRLLRLEEKLTPAALHDVLTALSACSNGLSLHA
jgi:hypothetical protein